MNLLRSKFIYLMLISIFIFGQSFTWVSIFQQWKNEQQKISQKDLALKLAAQETHQIYCVGNWQAQFQANPLPSQNQHPILAVQLDPHLPAFFYFKTISFSQYFTPLFISEFSNPYQVVELEPPRVS